MRTLPPSITSSRRPPSFVHRETERFAFPRAYQWVEGRDLKSLIRNYSSSVEAPAGASIEDLSFKELQAEFDELTRTWKRETFFHSSVSKKVFHESYQTIMAMGPEALPLILGELQRGMDHWFYALSHILRRDVADGADSMEEARERWLAWGKSEGYLP